MLDFPVRCHMYRRAMGFGLRSTHVRDVIEAMRAVAPPTVAVVDRHSEWFAIASHRLAAAHRRPIEAKRKSSSPNFFF